MGKANWTTVLLDYTSAPVVQILEDWTMQEYTFASGHPFEEILISGERGVIRASSERVELSDATGNGLQVWHLPRPGQSLPGSHLTTAWFPDSFGAAMAAFLSAVRTGVGREQDWTDLAGLTSDTLVVSDAIDFGTWLPFDGAVVPSDTKVT